MTGSCNLSDLLRRAAQVHGARPAVFGDDLPSGGLDYLALDRIVDHIVDCIADRIVDRIADRIATQLPAAATAEGGEPLLVLAENSWRLLALHFAIARCGAITVPLSPRATAAEVRAIAERTRARRAIADRVGLEVCGSVPTERIPLDDLACLEPDGTSTDIGMVERPRTTADDPALLYFTSGTTGHPKGVVLTHGNVLVHALAAIHEVRLDSTSVWGHYAPMFHLADAWAIWAVTAVGGAHVFEPRFDAERTWRSMERHAVTHTNLVPTMLQRMLRSDRPEPGHLSMRCLLSGGAPIAPSVVEELEESFGCRYMQTYGMTETSPYLTITGHEVLDRCLDRHERALRAARTGRPFLGVDLRVVDDTGSEVPHDDRSVGEIQVRGPSVTPGYFEDEEATAAAFTADGYLHTGDLATVDADGSVRIVDRRKDVILSGGETIYSTEVEHRILAHPDVELAAVFALPDDDLGECVCAAVVLRTGARFDASALRAFCREELAGPKAPRRWFELDDLPRTASGKISKKLLRERFESE